MDTNIKTKHVAPFCKPKEFAFFKPGDVAPSGADKRSPIVNRLHGAFQERHLCRRQLSSPAPSYQHRKRSKGRHTSKTPTTTSPTSSHLLNKPPEVKPYQ